MVIYIDGCLSMHKYKYEINLKKETIRFKEESKIKKILISEGNSK